MPTPETVDDVMTRSPRSMRDSSSVRKAAQQMKESSIGAVVVESDGKLRGIVTDRDIVVRCIALGGDPDKTKLAAICSGRLVVVSPRDALDKAIGIMRTNAVRRIPVVEGGRAVGILSLGDLARARDPNSVLGDISVAQPNL